VVDPHGRLITSVRVSITQKCNLHCLYCHQEGEDNQNHESLEMTPEEIQRIIEVLESFGVRRVKLTGGEPLIRRDIQEIVEGIDSVNGISEVSITTNGTRLKEFAKPLKDGGLARVNVSLDTLNPEIYKKITGVDTIEKAVSGIRKAVEVGLKPVKVNMVLLKGVNDGEVGSMIQFAQSNGVVLQLIELESPREDEFYRRYHSDMMKIEEQLKNKAEKVSVRQMHHRRKYYLPDRVEVEVVRPMHNTELCQYCNQIRITSDG